MSDPARRPGPVPSGQPSVAMLVVGTVCLALILGAFVYLVQLDHIEAAFAVLAVGGPFIGSLLVTQQVSKNTAEQNEVIARIERQTNGVLDARIRDGVTAALKETGVAKPGAGVTGHTPAPPPVELWHPPVPPRGWLTRFMGGRR